MPLVLSLLSACSPAPVDAPDLRAGPSPAATRRYDTACADGEVVYGIDVSYWQSTIDWDAVAGTGIDFAIARVSHGLGTYDTQFTANWAGMKEQGLVRGVYQYFDAHDDPTAQAQLLLDEIGALEEGDLPPVLDVEQGDNEGISQSDMNAAILEWMAVVEGALGRKPLIYTGAYAWDEMTGDLDMGEYPLWTANWTDDCPYIPNPWSRWTFWQYSATGSVSGISGDVDLDAFNGSSDALWEWAYHPEETCSGTCLVAAEGDTSFEEDDPCSCPEGGLTDADGHDGHAYTTTADNGGTEAVSWALRFESAGEYQVFVWVPAGSDHTTSAIYAVTHDGVTDAVTVDTSGVSDDWLSLGSFSFAASGTQSVRVGDAFGDAADEGRVVPIDALRFRLVTTAAECDDGEGQSQVCSDGSVRTRDCDAGAWTSWSDCVGRAKVVEEEAGCGCRAAGVAPSTVGAVLLGIGAFVRRRRGLHSSGPERA